MPNIGPRLKCLHLMFTIIAVLSPSLLAPQVHAQTLVTLYSFLGGLDGSQPAGEVVVDGEGNVYGMTTYGGLYDHGAVFEVSFAGADNTLYSFSGGADGSEPYGGLAFDDQGSAYGTTYKGGLHRRGTLFKLTPAGIETALYSFKGGADGAYPKGTPIFDTQGNLYGITNKAGGSGHYGTVFEVSPSGAERVLYAFSGYDGEFPEMGVVLDSYGNIHGTTYKGGTYSEGTVFELDPAAGVLESLYSFNKRRGGPASPAAGLLMDAQGNLYGTTAGGFYHGGTVFEVTQSGSVRVLYNFCALRGCTDGSGPEGKLALDNQGNLYGTTVTGGAQNGGTIFELTSSGVERVLYSFCAQQNCMDGENPIGGLTFDMAGNLYGATFAGGSNSRGTVFRLTP